MKEEIWKDIPNYVGYYQASNLGNIKSLDRLVQHQSGTEYIISGKLKSKRICKNTGYYKVDLKINSIKKTFNVHQLIAMTFLKHIPNKYDIVVDHIDNNKLNNSLENLQLTTQRHNSSKNIKNCSSKYTGVHYQKKTPGAKPWMATIRINNKKEYLGSFDTEIEAHNAYKQRLINE